MTEGVNCGGGRRTRLTIDVVCYRRPLPHIYIGWRGGEVAKGAPQVGGILLGVAPKPRAPPAIYNQGGRKEGGEGRK